MMQELPLETLLVLANRLKDDTDSRSRQQRLSHTFGWHDDQHPGVTASWLSWTKDSAKRDCTVPSRTL